MEASSDLPEEHDELAAEEEEEEVNPVEDIQKLLSGIKI